MDASKQQRQLQVDTVTFDGRDQGCLKYPK